MADPLRRTLLAKLRGKKGKKGSAAVRVGTGEGNDKVYRARDAQNRRAELDYIPGTMRGKQACVHRGFERRFEQCAHAGRGCEPSPFRARQEHKLSEPVGSVPKQEAHCPQAAQELTKQPVAFPRRHTEGDSIGFGNCTEVPFTHQMDGGTAKGTDSQEPVNTSVPSTGCGKGLEMDQCVTFGWSEPGRTNADQSGPEFFQYLHPGALSEHDLIQTIESSLELCGDFSMPTMQSPTFFPTELEIIDASLAPRFICAREGTTRHNSVDSEDDDYYDNEILPFYESKDSKGPAGQSSNPCNPGLVQIDDPSAQETDRLRSQLKEAYYLLINTLGDEAFDGHVEPNGYIDHGSSSSQSHDSLSVGSQSSTRHSRSSVEQSVHHWVLGDVIRSSRKSKSLENLSPFQERPNLRRSMSDGGVRYPDQNQDQTKNGSFYDTVPLGTISACGPLDASPEIAVTLGAESVWEHAEEETGGSTGNQDAPGGLPSGKPKNASAQRAKHGKSGGIIAWKPPGVTVNKMQEWMHKGRLLSSEMRQRIAGSTSHGGALEAGGKNFNHASSANGNKMGNSTGGHPSSTSITNGSKMGNQSAGHQPVPGTDTQDLCPRPAPLNSITVSKKRNWLNQSSVRPSPPSDEDDHAPPPRTRANTHRVPALVSDPAEENDADDEGEIWYNPIPEDEEADLHHCQPRTEAPGRTSGVEGGTAGAVAGDSGSLNAVQSNESSQGCRQTCGSQEEKDRTTRPSATESSDQGVSGLSPPSSPNPAKKSCSINWSLPERIKSPRTVRKLSMKMKKLPELSRKLSVKGNPTNGQPDPRTQLLKANGPADLGPTGVSTASAGGNVIWRYHLDSSVSTQQQKKSSELGAPKSAIKGGYLSDGDSPELVAKSGKHGSGSKAQRKMQDKDSSSGIPKLADVASFRPYSPPEQGKSASPLPVSGLLSVHLCGAEGLKAPRSDESRHIYCAIQVDEAKRARTALLPCHGDFLAMDHTFQLDLEDAQRLRLVLFGCEATTAPRRQRVCCHGAVALAPLFRTTRSHKLAVRLEPRGVMYVKLGLAERQSLSEGTEGDRERERAVFGVDAARVVEREAAGLLVPLIIEMCVAEIERRGCHVVGLYRLCGSAAVKKELREAFERDSLNVELSETNYPDVNVITGVLKDYLRELPQPLISKPLYEAVLDAMAKRPLIIGAGGCENDPADSEHAAGLLETLPEVEKVTLRKLLDHLKRVASHHEVNKMTCQNLAVCFGPVLLSQRQDALGLANRVFMDSEELASALHFKKHIEVLHYLLQLWPVVDEQSKPSSPTPLPPAPVRRRKERPQVLNLSDAELAGVLRPRAGRLDSPSNRYAGDWSDCRETYLHQSSVEEEADYADVPYEELPVVRDEDKDADKDEENRGDDRMDEGVERTNYVQIEVETEQEDEAENLVIEERRGAIETQILASYDCKILDPEECISKDHTYQAFMKIQEISPVLSNRVNLRDLQDSIDALIGNLEQELNKNKLSISY
ncbi:rho GTPase-activating protein SYDE2 [Trichomycterus rosablanca]|uniref:rho GTPase-activating protein SYDE2 n=1 Tax=Trichomycterus rosablanca TaxID=2290929 RepID=UPI002F360600